MPHVVVVDVVDVDVVVAGKEGHFCAGGQRFGDIRLPESESLRIRQHHFQKSAAARHQPDRIRILLRSHPALHGSSQVNNTS